MTYQEWLQASLTILQIQDTTGIAAFTVMAPRFIENAEGRLYRDPELDFLVTRVEDDTQQTTAAVRAVPIPSQFVIVEGASIITPAGSKPADAGAKRIPLLRLTRTALDLFWPVESDTQAPAEWQTYFAIYSQQQTAGGGGEADEPGSLPSSLLIGPTPDDAYTVEITGTQRPAPLSAGNTTTFLTQYLPDLFLAASLIPAFGYQRDFGAQSDDPKAAMSWESLFQELRKGAAFEELRKKSLVGGMSANPPVQMSSPEALMARAQQMQTP